MDKYDVIHDYYCYPSSAVLKNKLGITDASIFEQAERDITSLTKDEWIQANIDGVQVEYGKMEQIFARILQTTQDIKQELLTGRTRLV